MRCLFLCCQSVTYSSKLRFYLKTKKKRYRFRLMRIGKKVIYVSNLRPPRADHVVIVLFIVCPTTCIKLDSFLRLFFDLLPLYFIYLGILTYSSSCFRIYLHDKRNMFTFILPSFYRFFYLLYLYRT